MGTPVYLEVGKATTFACSLDWPGWSRAAKTEEAALEALAAYADRYRPVADEAGVDFPKSAGELEVVERVTGNPTTDFGAPGVPAAADDQPLTKVQAERLATLVAAALTAFDRVAARAPTELRKGPRGGGRDRDKMVAHVLDAEVAYFGKVGLRDRGREGFLDGLRAARRAQPELKTKSWPWRYTARRVAWHALDHAWEMQDRSS